MCKDASASVRMLLPLQLCNSATTAADVANSGPPTDEMGVLVVEAVVDANDNVIGIEKAVT